MTRAKVVKSFCGQTYEVLWEVGVIRSPLSSEYVEFRINGKRIGACYAFGYDAAKARYNEFLDIIKDIP